MMIIIYIYFAILKLLILYFQFGENTGKPIETMGLVEYGIP